MPAFYADRTDVLKIIEIFLTIHLGHESAGVDAVGADPDAAWSVVPDVPAAQRPGVPAAALAQLHRGAQDGDQLAGVVLREARPGGPEVLPRRALPARLRLAPPARGRD